MVMECNRKGCGNIMCDIYISEIGYICDECRCEFQSYLEKEKGTNILPEGTILTELIAFMDTPKNTRSTKLMSIDQFFKQG